MKEDWAALACFLHVALGSKSERSSNPKNTKGYLDMKCMLMAVLRKKKNDFCARAQKFRSIKWVSGE